MKVILVNVRKDDRRLPPLGTAYVAGYLKSKNVNVEIIDPTPLQLSNNFSYIKNILSKNPNLVGFTINAVNANDALNIAKKLKQQNPEIQIVFGGPQASAIPEDYLIDYVIIGEGEIAMYKLSQAIQNKIKISEVPNIMYKVNKETKINPTQEFIKDLDTLPYPARDLLPLNWYFQRDSIIRGHWGKGTSVLWSRGCPYNCLFCTTREIFGRKLRLRNPKKITDELEHLKNKYNLTDFYVLDDILGVNKTWTINICKEIISRNLNIKWGCQMRTNLVNEEVLKYMKRAGCVSIEYGCESGSQRVLDGIRKGITPEHIKKAFKLTKKTGIDNVAYFMIGNPYEKKEDIKQTVKLAKTIDADFYEFSIATPYPGSDLWKLAKTKGWIKSKDYSKAFHTGDKAQSMMEINFTDKELKKIKKYLYGMFKSKYFIKFMKQPTFVYDLASTLLTSPETLSKVIKFTANGEIEKGAWAYFHKQRLKE